MLKRDIVSGVIIAVLAGAVLFLLARGSSSVSPAPQLPSASSSSSYAPDTWKTWRDGAYSKSTGVYTSYEFQYPRDFDVRTLDQANGGFLTGAGTARAQVGFPRDAFQVPKSNYGEAYLTISYTPGATPAYCYAAPESGRGATGPMSRQETINGIPFYTATTTDVGAGNIYDSRIYRAMFSGYCFEFAETVHTGNIGNYPPGTTAPFDEARAFSILDQILSTLKFSTSTQPGGV